MMTLREMYGLHGYTISAVDLIHGIGKAAGLEPLHVDGATGYIDTNYSGKTDALLEGIKKSNFIFLHVESPDESGHEGNLDHKLQSIEDFDSKIVGPVLEGMKSYEDFTILVMPDHPTPLRIRTHTSDPVPFAIFRNRSWNGDIETKSSTKYCESYAKNTGLYIEKGYTLLELMVNDRFKQ